MPSDGPVLDDGDDTVWLSTPDGSWAVGWTPAGAGWAKYEVSQHGPRDLWTEAQNAWNAWEAAARAVLAWKEEETHD